MVPRGAKYMISIYLTLRKKIETSENNEYSERVERGDTVGDASGSFRERVCMYHEPVRNETYGGAEHGKDKNGGAIGEDCPPDEASSGRQNKNGFKCS